jgi:uncharacterized membrane protein (UPF0127 family)
MTSNRPSSDSCKIFFWLLFFILAVSCKSQGIQFETTELTIQTTSGNMVNISVELAISDEQRAQGLMYRQNLDDGKGMIFIFERDQMLSFWMKNTHIPLSIAFISADGEILEIRNMIPLDLTPVMSSRSARFALEVPQSWFSRAGISVGDTLLRSRELIGRR